MDNLKQVLMTRDNITASMADIAIREAQDELMERLSAGDLYGAEYLMEDLFGLEPDYLMDLI